jgi:lincosamide nucleotidyltransferase A/C/D/E
VADVLDRFDRAGLWYCIEGGWGVDALLGEQTRQHRDLDLGVRLDDVDGICTVLAEFERDDSEWPSSVILEDPAGRRVDAHPLSFDEAGEGWQANRSGDPYRWPREQLDARGVIGGREVRCITPELQLRWHRHGDFDDLDWADMDALARRFGLPEPDPRPGFLAPRRSVERKAHRRNGA